MLQAAIFIDKVGIVGGSLGGNPCKRFKIHPVEAEPRVEAFQPLIIVEKGPVKVASHIDAVLATFFQGIDVPLMNRIFF